MRRNRNNRCLGLQTWAPWIFFVGEFKMPASLLYPSIKYKEGNDRSERTFNIASIIDFLYHLMTSVGLDIKARVSLRLFRGLCALLTISPPCAGILMNNRLVVSFGFSVDLSSSQLVPVPLLG